MATLKTTAPTVSTDVPFNVRMHLQLLYQKVGSLAQAIVSNASSETVATEVSDGTAVTAGVSSFNGATGAVGFFPNLGAINDQTGATAYSTQVTDSGAVVVLDDASAVAVTLTATVGVPWYAAFVNLGAGTVTLTPSSGTISYGASSGASSMPIPSGQSVVVWFDGTNFWAETVPIATASMLGLVQPDGATVTVADGVISVPAATASVPGLIQLAEDIGGSASAPQVVNTHLADPLPMAQGGSGTATPALVAGANITITGDWPAQTIAASTAGASGTVTLAALSGTGTEGSLTFVDGLITAFVAPA